MFMKRRSMAQGRAGCRHVTVAAASHPVSTAVRICKFPKPLRELDQPPALTSDAQPEPADSVGETDVLAGSQSAVEPEPDSRAERDPVQRRSRSKPPNPPLDALLKAKMLTVDQAAQRYPSISKGAFRHLIFQHEPERRNPSNGREPQGFARCIVRPEGMKRKVLIDCEALDALLRESPGSVTRHLRAVK